MKLEFKMDEQFFFMMKIKEILITAMIMKIIIQLFIVIRI